MRRRYPRHQNRRAFVVRAPRRGTLIVAAICYALGVLGGFNLLPVLKPYAVTALTVAGGLLILGALLRDL